MHVIMVIADHFQSGVKKMKCLFFFHFFFLFASVIFTLTRILLAAPGQHNYHLMLLVLNYV